MRLMGGPVVAVTTLFLQSNHILLYLHSAVALSHHANLQLASFERPLYYDQDFTVKDMIELVFHSDHQTSIFGYHEEQIFKDHLVI